MTREKPPASPDANPQITIRVSPRFIERADALIEFVSDRSGRNVTRADVWREALVLGLAALERERAKSPPR